MYRRRLLRGLATLATGVTAAGCSGERNPGSVPRGPPVGPAETPTDDEEGTPTSTVTEQFFVVPTWSYEESDTGTLVFLVTVKNQGQSTQSALLSVVVKAQGREQTGRTVVTLDPGEKRTVRVQMPVRWSTFEENPNLHHLDFEPTDRTETTSSTPTQTAVSTNRTSADNTEITVSDTATNESASGADTES